MMTPLSKIVRNRSVRRAALSLLKSMLTALRGSKPAKDGTE